MAFTTKTARTEKRISEEYAVPRLSPPYSAGFVRKLPGVAPKGVVITNAILI